jgi:hypothetical protein
VPRRRQGRPDLVLPPARPRSDDRTAGLRAQTLIAGVGQQGHARGEGQQLDRAGVDPARTEKYRHDFTCYLPAGRPIAVVRAGTAAQVQTALR